MNDDQTQDAPSVDELNILKQRATMLGIKFSNNIGVNSLREKIQQVVEAKEPNDTPVETTASSDPLATKPLSASDRRKLRQREALKLVRCRITCMNPKKKELYGEIYTVANGHIGTVRKFVPYGEATENGFHIPNCIYRMLKKRQFQNIRTIKERGTGRLRVETNWAKEFAIEVLPPLTKEELKNLAAKQSNAGVHS